MNTHEEVRLVLDELSSKSDRTVAITGLSLLDPAVEACLLARFRVVCTLNVTQPNFEKTLASFIGWNKRRRMLFPVVLQRQALARDLAHFLGTLGLERRPPKAVDLGDYLARRYPSGHEGAKAEGERH